MQIKALSPLLALSCLTGLAVAFGCSDPPEATTPPPTTGGSTSGGSSSQAGTADTGGSAAGTTPVGGSTPTGGTGATAGAGTEGGTGGTDAGGTGGSGTAGAGGGVEAPTYPGYTLVINENFDAPINLNTDKVWTWSDGGLNEGQVRFTEDSITFADGKMKITTSKPAGGVPASPSFAENTGAANLKGFPLKSGEFRTKYNNYRYGRYEASIKAPLPVPADKMQGNFINTLFVFRTPKIEDWREIDIEIIAGDQVWSNVVFGDKVTDYGQTQHGAGQTTAMVDTRATFHTYAFEWKADKVTWFVDGNPTPVRTHPGTPAGDGNPPIPDKSGKIMMSMWVFGAPGYDFGSVDKTTGKNNVYPFTAEYEFFRFYKQDGETYPMDTAALPAEDKNLSKNNPKETDTQG